LCVCITEKVISFFYFYHTTFAMLRELASESLLEMEECMLARIIFHANKRTPPRFTSITLARNAPLIDFSRQHTDGWGGPRRTYTRQPDGTFLQHPCFLPSDVDRLARILSSRISEYWLQHHEEPNYTGECFVELTQQQACVGFLRDSPLPDGVQGQQPSVPVADCDDDPVIPSFAPLFA
jgi:hypothetical protein